MRSSLPFDVGCAERRVKICERSIDYFWAQGDLISWWKWKRMRSTFMNTLLMLRAKLEDSEGDWRA
ncbi:hypothetical protein DUNSADRAFT_1436 [Dunaliella salina]|uniref:Encoded protein n=1 Tax=Dunaliella salina TaxID=3046 RepID=A0ABQ7FXI7_DUNSA|nr:hypothetical protein DUNSADRAFT_1436 [Dunaliella salina]|eukprot:KAF5827048.1 hypothetical protein DUNSADRAFT_1436 [Dunaliella salina]